MLPNTLWASSLPSPVSVEGELSVRCILDSDGPSGMEEASGARNLGRHQSQSSLPLAAIRPRAVATFWASERGALPGGHSGGAPEPSWIFAARLLPMGLVGKPPPPRAPREAGDSGGEACSAGACLPPRSLNEVAVSWPPEKSSGLCFAFSFSPQSRKSRDSVPCRPMYSSDFHLNDPAMSGIFGRASARGCPWGGCSCAALTPPSSVRGALS
mmetsp:Transcript_22604/g.63202  ORF Transcript_22604/g.63202 Transcript_22604/m.63202 type:complete len:213 (-) Transcript_22604:7-645(-)